MKVFRVFIFILAIALIAGAAYFFFKIDKTSEKLNEDMLKGAAIYSELTESNRADFLRYKDWLVYKENWEKQPKAQAYRFFKELDEEYIPKLNSRGWASFAICCLLIFLLALLLIRSPSPAKEMKPAARQTASKPRPAAPITASVSTPAPRPKQPKLDAQALLRKAAICAENEPMQSISYLEQAMEESLSVKLSVPALLLCGSLRLKNKIGEEQGKGQLRRIITGSPQSQEAKKAQKVLDTFK